MVAKLNTSSTQQFVPLLVGIFLKMTKIGHFALKVKFVTI